MHSLNKFIAFACKAYALELPFCPSSAQLFRNIVEFGARKYFADYQTANTIQLFVTILYKGIYLFFFWTSLNRRGIPQGLLDKYSNHPVFINMTLIFLLAACANSLVDSF